MITDSERAIVDLIGKRFISHGVHYAEQESNGNYHPVTGAFTRPALVDHLHGTRSYGHYLVSPEDDCVKLIGFDLDLRKEPVTIDDHVCENPRDTLATMPPHHPDREVLVLQLRMLAYHLSHRLSHIAKLLETPVTVASAFSGSKGIHVYGWFEHRRPAEDAITVGKTVLASFKKDGLIFEPVRGSQTYRNELGFSAVDLEIYPKQGSVKATGKSHGNLMRLPLGKNRKTNGESFFLKPLAFDGDEYRFVSTDPLAALEHGTL